MSDGKALTATLVFIVFVLGFDYVRLFSSNREGVFSQMCEELCVCLHYDLGLSMFFFT